MTSKNVCCVCLDRVPLVAQWRKGVRRHLVAAVERHSLGVNRVLEKQEEPRLNIYYEACQVLQFINLQSGQDTSYICFKNHNVNHAISYSSEILLNILTQCLEQVVTGLRPSDLDNSHTRTDCHNRYYIQNSS